MDALEWKNYKAEFEDGNGNDRKITFSSNASDDELLEYSAAHQIQRKTGINPRDVSDLDINEIEVW